MVHAAEGTGRVGMVADRADALAAFRQFNYRHIYLRPASMARPRRWSGCCRPWSSATPTARTCCPPIVTAGSTRGSPEALRAAVTYVGGMTDRYAFQQAVSLLGWDPQKLPAGIDSRW